MPRSKIIPLSANARPATPFKDMPPSSPMKDMADVQEARRLGYDMTSGMIDMDELRAWLAARRIEAADQKKPPGAV